MKYIIIAIIIALIGWGAYAVTNKNEAEIGGVQPETPAENTDAASGIQIDEREVKTFIVKGGGFYFDPSTIEVNEGDTVRIVFENSGGTHDWVIDEFNARTKVLSAGQSETIEFFANKKGSFEYYCSVGTHRQMGMKGTLIVK